MPVSTHAASTPSKRQSFRKLAAYVAAAGAALAGEEAGAGIKFTDLGPGGLALPDAFPIDLNNDATAEFVLRDVTEFRTGACTTDDGHCWHTASEVLFATGYLANEVLSNGDVFARALSAGSNIDATAAGRTTAELAVARFAYHHGPTSQSTYGGEFLFRRAYLGLTFDLPDGRHAGWAEIGVYAFDFPGGSFDAAIYGFAYETTPGATIAAGAVPEPPALVLLAAGAAGLALVRARRRLRTIPR